MNDAQKLSTLYRVRDYLRRNIHTQLYLSTLIIMCNTAHTALVADEMKHLFNYARFKPDPNIPDSGVWFDHRTKSNIVNILIAELEI